MANENPRTGRQPIARRGFLAGTGSFLVSGANGSDAATSDGTVSIIASAAASEAPPLEVAAFNMVGVFDTDWLQDKRFTRLLDTMAASPGAFGAVRFFGALNSGEKENINPQTSGIVWPAPDQTIDFSRTLAALEAVTSRGLVPFVGLNFFPSAVSPSPVRPPERWDNWQVLVRTFLDRCVAHFGASEVSRWWLEVWNEPNMPPFWGGTFDQYLDLYRATSDAVLHAGHAVRLGGPAIAYMPDNGAGLIERFLGFLHEEPGVKCDFISFHRKGIWVPQETQPVLQRSIEAARRTAQVAMRINAKRFRGLPIINNEADMKVGFDTPFEPRMTEQFPSWLMAQAIAYDRLTAEFAQAGLRFWAASDDANQHLIRAAFDGRRSIMTHLTGVDDLVKVPVYGFYEMLRLLARQHGTFRSQTAVYPHSDLYHLTTADNRCIAAAFTIYPEDGLAASATRRRVEYRLQDIPWQRVNIARFCISATLSNAFTAAGRAMPAHDLGQDSAHRIRMAQELTVIEPIRSNHPLQNGELREILDLEVFATILIWITPVSPTPPAAPRWLTTEIEAGQVILRWTPNTEPDFYSYTVRRQNGPSLAPTPLRSAMWVDTPPPGRHIYTVSAVSASGVASKPVPSPEIILPM